MKFSFNIRCEFFFLKKEKINLYMKRKYYRKSTQVKRDEIFFKKGNFLV